MGVEWENVVDVLIGPHDDRAAIDAIDASAVEDVGTASRPATLRILLAASPRSATPSDLRTELRAPSQPTTYRARTVSISPSWPGSTRSRVAVPGNAVEAGSGPIVRPVNRRP